VATKPNDPYVAPSSMNQPTRPRPTAGTYPPPAGANPPQPHSAFDGMDTAPDVMGADGDTWDALPDR
jgi:hypothetical protein